MATRETLSKRQLVTDRILGPAFWDEYAVLWNNSRDRSPFQSPEILKFFSHKFVDAVIPIRLINDQRLTAAVILKKVNGVYSFLSDLKSDANFFIIHNDCSDDDIEFFFTGLFDIIKRRGWAVMFNSVPAWDACMQVFEQCGMRSNLFFQSMNYSVCPVLKCDTPGEIRNIISRTRTIRNNANNLKSRLNAQFEVLTGDNDLETWVQEFCTSHVQRWKNTPTPSVYEDPGFRLFLLECLLAWGVDNVLVRFAVKVNGQRIGFHICLLDGDTLIGHAQTFHPDFSKVSPAKVLLLTIAEWMAENRLGTFDFGNGDERYKYGYINQERTLKRIFVSKKTNYSFVIRSKLIRLIKGNSGIYSFYRTKVKRLLKSAPRCEN